MVSDAIQMIGKKLAPAMSSLRTSTLREHSWLQIPQHVRFGRTLEIDHQFSVINEVCDTDETLVLRSMKRVGDRHVYFTISNMETTSDHMIAQLSHVANDTDGNGVEHTRQLKIIDHFDIDESARELIQAQPFALFRSHTRKVIFQGLHTDKVYPVYFKPGRIAGAEYVGRLFLGAAGLSSPRVVSSLLPHACWVEGVQGRTFESVLMECVKRRQPLSAWLDKDEEGSRRLFSTIGRAVGALYLCGSRDFHAENLLITPSRQGFVVDLECTGCPSQWRDHSPQEAMARPIRRMLEGLFMLKGLFLLEGRPQYDELKLDISPHYADALREGVESVFNLFRKPDGFMEKILTMVPENFYSRMVINATRMYVDAFGLRHSIPHYSTPIKKDKFVADVRERLQWVTESYTTHRPVWSEIPNFRFEK